MLLRIPSLSSGDILCYDLLPFPISINGSLFSMYVLHQRNLLSEDLVCTLPFSSPSQLIDCHKSHYHRRLCPVSLFTIVPVIDRKCELNVIQNATETNYCLFHEVRGEVFHSIHPWQFSYFVSQTSVTVFCPDTEASYLEAKGPCEIGIMSDYLP